MAQMHQGRPVPAHHEPPRASAETNEEPTWRYLVNDPSPPRLIRRLFATSCMLLVTALLVAQSLSAAAAQEPPSATTSTGVDHVEREPGRFTLADIAAGRVPQTEFDAFWAGERDRILAASCREVTGTSVTVFVGADVRWNAELSEAIQEHREACEQQREISADDEPDAPAPG